MTPTGFIENLSGLFFVFCGANLFISRGDHWSPLQNKIKLLYEK